MNTIQEKFKGYADKVIPKGASYIQRKETEQAFYSGAFSMMNIMLDVSEYDEETACKMLDTIKEEIDFYFNSGAEIK